LAESSEYHKRSNHQQENRNRGEFAFHIKLKDTAPPRFRVFVPGSLRP